MERGGAGGERERRARPRGTRPCAARARRRAGPVVSQPERRVSATAAISSSPIAGGWKPSVVSRRLSDTFGCIGDREAYGLGRRGGPRERLVARVADGEDRARPVGAAAERAEDVARAPVRRGRARSRAARRLLDPGDLARAARRAATRKRTQAPPARATRRELSSATSSPSAAASASRVQVDAERRRGRAPRRARRRAAPRARRPAAPRRRRGPACTSGPSLDPERRGGRGGGLARRGRPLAAGARSARRARARRRTRAARRPSGP